jgi:hypothetical protein
MSVGAHGRRLCGAPTGTLNTLSTPEAGSSALLLKIDAARNFDALPVDPAGILVE